MTTPSGAGWGRGVPQSRLGSGSGVPWVSVGRAGVRLWGSLDIPRAELGLVLRSLGSQSRLEPGSAIPPSFRRADGVPVWGSPRSPQQARVWLGRWFRWVSSAHTQGSVSERTGVPRQGGVAAWCRPAVLRVRAARPRGTSFPRSRGAEGVVRTGVLPISREPGRDAVDRCQDFFRIL